MSAPFNRDYATDFDLGDPELNEHWDEVVSDLHASGCPIARSDVGEGYWVVNTYKDVTHCAKTWETYSASEGFMVNRPAELPYFAPGESDPPLSADLRAALETFVRPNAATALEPVIREHADRLIDAFITTGEAEVVAQYANPLPQRAFSVEVAGMDADDMPYLLDCFSLTGPMEERAVGFLKGMTKIEEYLKQRSEEPPRGDIVDALLAFEHPGYEWMDKVGTMCQLTIGGIGTTGYAFSGGLHHLATHPEQRARLVEDPSRIPRAIDEFLRMFMGAPNMARRAVAPAELSGTTIEAGDRVLLSFGAASRDPAVIDRPDEIDLERKSVRHLAFGAGNHRCRGASLARSILRIGYEQFLARIPEFEVADGFEPTYETGNTRHMAELPLRFAPGEVTA